MPLLYPTQSQGNHLISKSNASRSTPGLGTPWFDVDLMTFLSKNMYFVNNNRCHFIKTKVAVPMPDHCESKMVQKMYLPQATGCLACIACLAHHVSKKLRLPMQGASVVMSIAQWWPTQPVDLGMHACMHVQYASMIVHAVCTCQMDCIYIC